MKNLLIFPLATCSLFAAEQPAKTVMRDVITHAELVKKLREAEASDPMKKMPQSQQTDPAKSNVSTDILKDSDFLCFNGKATLVPKRAILSLPENLKPRTVLQPNVPFVSWADFFAANRGWITAYEVSRKQAEGREDFPEETKKTIAESGTVIIATFKGGPISVLPLKPEVTDPGPANPAEPK